MGDSLQLEIPLGFLQSALQRSRDLVAFGLHAAAHAEPVDLKMPDSFGQVFPAMNQALTVAEAREEFRNWVLANGLRDCVEAIGPMLEWVRKFCFLWTRPGTATPTSGEQFGLSASLSGEEWNTHIVQGAKKFDRLPLPDKLSHLESTYSWTRPKFSDHVLSLNAARNCLAHRDGVVGLADLKDPGDKELTVRWCTLQFSVSDGSGERIAKVGDRVNAGETITPIIADTQKKFALGEHITFGVNEYVEFTLTFMLFAQQLGESALAIQQRRRDLPPIFSPGIMRLSPGLGSPTLHP